MENLETKDLELILNFFITKILERTGVSPVLANLMLSAVGRQELNLIELNLKTDRKIFLDALLILQVLKFDYFKVIDLIRTLVAKYERELVEISFLKGL